MRKHANVDAIPVWVLGARAYSLAFADAFADLPGQRVVGFVENRERDRAGTKHDDLPVIWVDELVKYRDTHRAMCSLGTTFRQEFVAQVDALGMAFATWIHPTSVISRRSTLGAGSSVNIGGIVAGFTNIGCHVHINRGVTIGHHTTIEDYVTVGPGCNVAGNCHIGAHTYIGIGATVIDGIRIGHHCVIGAGAVVTKDLPDRVLAVGVPAKIVKENVEGK